MRRTLSLLAAAATLTLCRVGGAQVYSEHLLEPYRFASLAADLEAAEIDVPPTVLVQAYRRALERFGLEQADLRAALGKAVGWDVRRQLELAEVDRAIDIIRRARAAAASVDESLFNELGSALPEDAAPGIAKVRGWRSTQRATPRIFQGPALYQFSDVGDLVRRSGASGEELKVALEALAPSEAARRNALLRIVRDDEEGKRAAARVAQEAAAGADPGGDLSRRMAEAKSVSGPVIADAIEAQLKGFQALRDVLPRHWRRLVFDQMSVGLIGDYQGGSGMNLPSRAFRPADVARRLLSSSELAPEQREKAREVLVRWLDEDDEAVLEGLTASVATLRSAQNLTHEVSRGIRQLQTRRGEIAARHLEAIAAIGGTDWLLDPSLPPPPLNEAVMSSEDRAAIGVHRLRPPPPASEVPGRADLLPTPLDQAAVDILTAQLAADEGQQAVARFILLEHAEAFDAQVQPLIEAAKPLIRSLAFQPLDETPDEKIESAAASLRTLRKQAFAASDAVEGATAAALVDALGQQALPAVRRTFAARRLAETILPFGRALHDVHVDVTRAGGAPCNIAAVVADQRVPPAVRAAVEAALAEEWRLALDLARPMREAATDAEHGRMLSFTQRTAQALERGEVGEASAASPVPQHRIEALVTLLEQWQAVEELLIARARDAAEAAGDPSRTLREAIDRAKFDRAFREVEKVDAAIAALREGEDFPGRAALLEELEQCRAALVALATRRADILRPRLRISEIPPADRLYVIHARGGQELAIMLVQWQLYDAATWLIHRMTPAEVLRASDTLSGLRATASW